MQRCGFKSRHSRLPGHGPPPETVDLDCQFYLQKGFVTIPLTYMLGEPCPHEPEDLAECFQFQIDGQGHEYISQGNRSICALLERGLSNLFCSHLGEKFPFVFSQSYVEKLTGTSKHIPTLARSLNRVMNIAETMKRTEFSNKAKDHIEKMRQKIAPFQPYSRYIQQENILTETKLDTVWQDLVVGLYYANKRSDSLRRHRVVFKSNAEPDVSPSSSAPSSLSSSTPSTGSNLQAHTPSTTDANPSSQDMSAGM